LFGKNIVTLISSIFLDNLEKYDKLKLIDGLETKRVQKGDYIIR
jgi:hypothetical protein